MYTIPSLVTYVTESCEVVITGFISFLFPFLFPFPFPFPSPFPFFKPFFPLLVVVFVNTVSVGAFCNEFSVATACL
jgi:hypothetical protein